MAAMAFAVSIALPPPNPTTRSHPALPGAFDRVADQVDRRLSGDRQLVVRHARGIQRADQAGGPRRRGAR